MVAEVTLAVVLVIGASLMAKSLWRTVGQDPGFPVDELLVTRFTFPETQYSPAEKAAFVQALEERVAALPGVIATSVAGRPPLLYNETWSRFSIPGRPEAGEGEEAPTASMVLAGEHLFEAMGISVVRGRLFDAGDDADSPPVVVIDEAMAARYWPGQDPVGQYIRFGSEEGQRIVGVVTPARWDGLVVQAPTFYVLANQMVEVAPFVLGTPTLITRTRGDPYALAGPVRDAVRALDPDIPVFMMRSMSDVVGTSLAGPRFILTLLGTFAGAALLLGAIGIYGVISQAVAQRTNEIGIRRALGAQELSVLGMVVRQGLLVALLGVALGLAAAAAAGGLLESFLYEVSSTDPWTYVTVALSVVLVAGVAVLVPARRASRVDPMEALRAE